MKLILILILAFIVLGAIAIIFNHIAHINTYLNNNIGNITHNQDEFEKLADAKLAAGFVDFRDVLKVVEYYSNIMEDAYILSADGLKLHGKYLLGADKNSWVLLMHGYTASYKTMTPIADKYYQKGYSVLIPNQRGHGDSEGTFSTYGVREAEDMYGWIGWIKKSYPSAKIILQGESMGATTAMYMTADSPKDVIACIEDCGYTSYYAMFKAQAVGLTGIFTYPMALIANIFIKYILKGDVFKSAIKSMEKTKIPTLFIHGGRDGLIPVKMCFDLYHAHPGKKDIHIATIAEHADSKLYQEEIYYEKIFNFLDDIKEEV